MKRKVNIDRKPLASEEIQATKDFGSLMSKVGGTSASSPKPNGSKMGWFAGGIAAVAIAAGIYFGTKKTDSTTAANETLAIAEQIDTTKEKSFVNPPIPELDIKNESYYVNADNGGKIKHHTGTEITIPEGAFMDEEGNIIKGEVEIQYREFHDQADIFLSGIPMEYDSAGEKSIFESAGMMEIRGFQNGKRLKIVPDKNFLICMHTKNPDPKFNVYYLDEKKEKWDYEGKDSVSVVNDFPETSAEPKLEVIKNAEEKEIKEEQIEIVEEKIEVIKKEVKKIKKTEPNKPRKADKNKKNFTIDVVAGEFPELTTYSGTIFEVLNNSDLPDDTYAVTWNDVKLKEKNSLYTIQLSKDERVEEIAVRPVLEGEDYEVAKKEFDNKFGEYTSKLNQKLKEEKEAEKKLAELKEKYEKQREEYNRQQQAIRDRMNVHQASRVTMTRVFNINRFGTWNCDTPVKYPRGMITKANYVDENGNPLVFSNLNLIERQRNACFPLTNTMVQRLPFNPKKTNVLWGVTIDGNIAVSKPNEFDNVSSQHTFSMMLIDVKGKTNSEIKSMITS